LAEGNHPDLKQMAARIIDLLEPELAADGYDLLDVRVFPGGGRLQLRIYVDRQEGGISLDQVAAASRTVGMLLEEADPFPGQYVIEVSSPGIRRPLRKLEHYQAAVGQKVDLKVPGQDLRRVRGILRAVEGNQLVVASEHQGAVDSGTGQPEEVKVPLARIQEGNLDPEFDVQALINADRRKRKEAKRARRQARTKNRKGRRKSRPRGPNEPEKGSSFDDGNSRS
jgi:ribosome maturation factor RimP